MMNNTTLHKPLMQEAGILSEIVYTKYALVGIAFLLSCMYASEKKKSHWWSENSPPGPADIPILGHILLLGTKPHVKLTEWSRRYGDIFRIQFGSHPAVIVNGIEAIRNIILTGDAQVRRAIAGRPAFPTLKCFNGGFTMTFSSPSDHSWYLRKRWMRQSITNYVAKNKEVLEENMVARANFLADELLDQKIVNPDVHISTTCITVILDMVCHSVQGNRQLIHHEKVKQLSDKFFELNDQTISPLPDLYPCLANVFKHTLRRAEDTTKVIANLFTDLLKPNVETFDNTDLRDITDHLLKASQSEETSEIIDFEDKLQLLSLQAELLGALESTAGTTLRWCFLYAAAFPKEQDLLHEEIERVVGDGPVTLSHERDLVRVKAFLAEVKRRSVVMPFLLPHCTIEDTKVGGYDVPKGTIILFNAWSALRDPNHWHEPEAFNPSRFIDEEGKLRYDLFYSFLHFGGGERRCIGQRIGQWSLFLLFANVLRRCRIYAVEGEDYDLDGKTEFTLTTKPYRVRVEAKSE